MTMHAAAKNAAEDDEFEERLQHIVEGCVESKLNEKGRKFFAWLVVMFLGSIGTLIYLGIQWGTLRAELTENIKSDNDHHRDASLHVPLDKKFETFVSRSEWAAIVREREKDYDDLKEDVSQLNTKLDRVMEMLRTRGGAE